MLAEIDTLVFDIQDIGARFYTYVSTMGEAMKACAEHGKRFVVLDRPNPIGGVAVAGPMLDAGKESFVGFHRLPVRHGMTIGELARMFQDELKLKLDLQVIECEGWKRADAWDATGLTWVNPSPNMRSLTQAFLYPGIGLLETTNVSVGRGTDTPFEVIGAPWLDGRKLAAELNARGIRRRALRADRVHAHQQQVRQPEMRRHQHRHHRPQPVRAAPHRLRDRRPAPQALSRTTGKPKATTGCSATRMS